MGLRSPQTVSATTCKCVCGFDERVQRQVEWSFCLAASVAFADNARYYA